MRCSNPRYTCTRTRRYVRRACTGTQFQRIYFHIITLCVGRDANAKQIKWNPQNSWSSRWVIRVHSCTGTRATLATGYASSISLLSTVCALDTFMLTTVLFRVIVNCVLDMGRMSKCFEVATNIRKAQANAKLISQQSLCCWSWFIIVQSTASVDSDLFSWDRNFPSTKLINLSTDSVCRDLRTDCTKKIGIKWKKRAEQILPRLECEEESASSAPCLQILSFLCCFARCCYLPKGVGFVRVAHRALLCANPCFWRILNRETTQQKKSFLADETQFTIHNDRNICRKKLHINRTNKMF